MSRRMRRTGVKGVTPRPSGPMSVAISRQPSDARPAARGRRHTSVRDRSDVIEKPRAVHRRAAGRRDPARHRRDAGPDRRPRLRRERIRVDAPVADRDLPFLQAGRVRDRPPGIRGPGDGLDRDDHLPRFARRRAVAPRLDRGGAGSCGGRMGAADPRVRTRPGHGWRAPAAGADRGQGSDRGVSLARRARRSGGSCSGRRNRAARRAGRLEAALGTQGAWRFGRR